MLVCIYEQSSAICVTYQGSIKRALAIAEQAATAEQLFRCACTAWLHGQNSCHRTLFRFLGEGGISAALGSTTAPLTSRLGLTDGVPDGASIAGPAGLPATGSLIDELAGLTAELPVVGEQAAVPYPRPQPSPPVVLPTNGLPATSRAIE